MQVKPEAIVRFPWRGGRHLCLDVLIEIGGHLIGVESKRYEPFRAKAEKNLSQAYARDVWGERMNGYQSVLVSLREGAPFNWLDAAQFVKHAFAFRTATQRPEWRSKVRMLYYLYAEPKQCSDGRPISAHALAEHRAEIETFAARVNGDEVSFQACCYATRWRPGTRAVTPRSARMCERYGQVRRLTHVSSSFRASSGSMIGMPSRIG